MKPDVVVIGAGPAGIAAAIQLRRYGLAPVMLERDRIGGLLHSANLVENYPGFPGGIAGPDLAALFERQLRSERIEVVFDELASLAIEGADCVAKTGAGLCLRGLAVIATGTEPILHPALAVPAAQAPFVGYEIAAVPDTSGQHIAIVGGGDAAFDYAARLGRDHRVSILYRSRQAVALPLLQDRVRQTPSVTLRPETEVVAIERGASRALCLTLTVSGLPQQVECDCLLFALGRRPCTNFLDENAIRAFAACESPPFYFAGDVANGRYRQTAIAVGDGLRVAMHICDRLTSRTQNKAVSP